MRLKYTHPSAMKYDIKKTYSLDDLKKELSLDMIKLLFTPLDFNWEQLEKPKKSKRETIEFGIEEQVGEN